MSGGELPIAKEVQRPIVYPYRSHCSRHLFARVDDPVAARKFVRGLRKDIIDASRSDEDIAKMPVALNLGFTYAGLEALGLPKAYRRVFEEKAQAFVEGPSLRAARRLGDTGPSAAQWWEEPFHHRRIHIYLVAHGDDPAVLKSSTDALLGDPSGLTVLAAIDGAHFKDSDPDYRKVHFGFRDNVANPTIKGWPRGKLRNEPLRPESEHAPGEFVLGYRTNNKDNPWLLISPSPSSAPWLLPRASIEPGFFRNGSFGIFRKMEQDVAAFESSVAGWARELKPPVEMTTKEREAYIRAKICGRWDNGLVVLEGEYRPGPDRGGDLDTFDFTKDRKGEGCPFGSHIRRMNPRGDEVVPRRKRPLIRRGMPYGSEHRKGDDEKRGLLGLFFCASLEDQFEHLLCEWGDANPMGPPNCGTAKDPFTGAHGGESVFDIPIPGSDLHQLDAFRSFVTTRGTLYAFFPGLEGIEIISRELEPARAQAA